MKHSRVSLTLLSLAMISCSACFASLEQNIAGTWKVSVPAPTGVLDLIWKIESDGSYESWIENAPAAPHETGKLEAANGKFSVKRLTGPNAGKPDSGTYDISNPNLMLMNASTGPSQWTRVEKKSGSAGYQPASDLPVHVEADPGSTGGPTTSNSPTSNGLSTETTTSGDLSSSQHLSRLAPLINTVAGLAANAGAQRYIPNSVKRYIPNTGTMGGIVPSGGLSALGSGVGSLGSSTIGMGAASGFGGQSNPQLGYAQDFERKGEWFNACQKYENAMLGAGGDITKADMAAAARNHTSYLEEMQKRMATDPTLREIQKHLVYCNCQLIKERYAGKPGNTDLNHSIFSLNRAYNYLELTDKDNAVWYYLGAVYWCFKTDTMEYNYKQAWVKLNNALSCKILSPTLRTKIQALRHHIFPAMMLQLKDLDRAKFDRMKGIVENVEHPTIIDYVDRSGNVVNTYDSRNTLDTAFYGVCKDMLAHDYPQFISDYNAFIRYVRSLPNKGIPIPPGNDEEVTRYGIPQWEQKAFGPLNFSTGRL